MFKRDVVEKNKSSDEDEIKCEIQSALKNKLGLQETDISSLNVTNEEVRLSLNTSAAAKKELKKHQAFVNHISDKLPDDRCSCTHQITLEGDLSTTILLKPGDTKENRLFLISAIEAVANQNINESTVLSQDPSKTNPYHGIFVGPSQNPQRNNPPSPKSYVRYC